MYIETKDKNNNSNNKNIIMSTNNEEHYEVNEATAALKGMLGIGVAASSSSSTSPSSLVAKNEGEVKKNKKKVASKKKKKQQQQQQQQQDTTTTNTNSAPTTKTKKIPKQEKSEKFAWSAFQTSPDASTLPIPAFSPAAVTKPTKTLLDVTDIIVVPSSKNATVPLTNNNDETSKPIIDTVGMKTDEAEMTLTKETEKTEETKKIDTDATTPVVSDTGVNLAALAASPIMLKPQENRQHPAPSQAAAAAAGTAFPNEPQHLYHHHHQQQQHLHQQQQLQQQQPVTHYPPPQSQEQQQPFHSVYSSPQQQQHHHHHQSQFVTIQVQVPVLGPGRQMVVQSPMGYPVQVTVPDGILPGMVIPVHIPTGPTPPPPPPPPPHHQQQQQQQQPQQQHVIMPQQQQQQPQLPPPHGGPYPYGHAPPR